MRRNPISRRGTSGNPDVLSRLGIAFLSFVLMVVVASPILVLLSRSLQGPHPEIVVSDDLAVAELYTLRASRGQQLVGSYSRFRFHHPGPAQFYFLAPFYAWLFPRCPLPYWSFTCNRFCSGTSGIPISQSCLLQPARHVHTPVVQANGDSCRLVWLQAL